MCNFPKPLYERHIKITVFADIWTTPELFLFARKHRALSKYILETWLH